MEDKLQEILDEHQKEMYRFEEEIKNYREQMRFFDKHKFEEELRITRIKHDAGNMILFNYKQMCNDIEKLLNAWNS